jgi:hypothetical protein
LRPHAKPEKKLTPGRKDCKGLGKEVGINRDWCRRGVKDPVADLDRVLSFESCEFWLHWILPRFRELFGVKMLEQGVAG